MYQLKYIFHLYITIVMLFFWLPSSLTITLSDNTFKSKIRHKTQSFFINEAYISGYHHSSILKIPKTRNNVCSKKHISLLDLHLLHYKRVLQIYKSWIVTPQWWIFSYKAFSKLSVIIWQETCDRLNSWMIPILRNIIGPPNITYYKLPIMTSLVAAISNSNFLYKWNQFVLKNQYQKQSTSKTIWNYLKFYSKCTC